MISKLVHAMNPVKIVFLEPDEAYSSVYWRLKRSLNAHMLEAQDVDILEGFLNLLEVLHSETLTGRFNLDRDREACRAMWDWKFPPEFSDLSDADLKELCDAITRLPAQQKVNTLRHDRKQRMLLFLCLRITDILQALEVNLPLAGKTAISFEKVKREVDRLESYAAKLLAGDAELYEFMSCLLKIPIAAYKNSLKIGETDLAKAELRKSFDKFFAGVRGMELLKKCIANPLDFDLLFTDEGNFWRFCDDVNELISACLYQFHLDANHELKRSDESVNVTCAQEAVRMQHDKQQAYFDETEVPPVGGRIGVGTVGISDPEKIQKALESAIALAAGGIHTYFTIDGLVVTSTDLLMLSHNAKLLGELQRKECLEFRCGLEKLLKGNDFAMNFRIATSPEKRSTFSMREFMKLDRNGQFSNRYTQNIQMFSLRASEHRAADEDSVWGMTSSFPNRDVPTKSNTTAAEKEVQELEDAFRSFF